VIRPGWLTTVQDLGRPGYQRFGMPVGGAMDPVALRLANRLVGNPDSAAALEMTVQGPALLFEQEAVIALAGADLSPLLDGQPVPNGTAVAVGRESQLTFGERRSGARGYLAVAGGIDVPLQLRSRSTHVASGTGGRSLRLRWVLCVFKEVRMSALLLMAQPGGAANQNPLTAFIPIVLIIVVFYFLLIRPQQKRAKAQKAMLDDLKAGDAVVTIGGLRGTVAAVDNDTVIIRVADNVKLTFNKSAVAGVVKSE